MPFKPKQAHSFLFYTKLLSIYNNVYKQTLILMAQNSEFYQPLSDAKSGLFKGHSDYVSETQCLNCSWTVL